MSEPAAILVVDDHRVFAEGLVSILSIQFPGFTFENVHRGEEAWSRLQDHQEFRMVITDISMPGMSGLDLATRIKSQRPGLGVLILSMHDEPAIVKAAMETEADGFVLKTASAAEIGHAVRDILDNRTHYSPEVMRLFLQGVRGEKQEALKEPLSTREIEVLRLIVEELPSEEIAQRLFISRRTVDTHRANILEKTGCRNLIALYKYAIRNGLA
ncbi:MAG: response regulator transcription factor [Cyclobacteriaceae bacterium]|nr:response regulator transcription factor [Cyclobacteriaceae bacterium]